MGLIVQYHHPQAENSSLKYSSISPSELVTRQADLDDTTKLIGYPFDSPVYVLYERDTEIESAADIDYDRDWLSDRIAELDREGQDGAF